MSFRNPEQIPALLGNRTSEAFTDWLTQQIEALQSLQWFVQAIIGNADGIVVYSPPGMTVGQVTQNDSPNMQIKINSFAGVINSVPFHILDPVVTAALTPPVSNPRIDAVVARALPGRFGEFRIITGAESASPSAPAIVADTDILLAHIYHLVGESAITNENESGGDGWIEDARAGQYINA